MGKDCGLCSMPNLRLLKDFKKHNSKLEKMVLHEVQAQCFVGSYS